MARSPTSRPGRASDRPPRRHLIGNPTRVDGSFWNSAISSPAITASSESGQNLTERAYVDKVVRGFRVVADQPVGGETSAHTGCVDDRVTMHKR